MQRSLVLLLAGLCTAAALLGTARDIRDQPELASRMVVVEGGTFDMGSTIPAQSTSENQNYPLHSVTVSPFRMSSTVVTNAMYVDFLNAAYAAGEIEYVAVLDESTPEGGYPASIIPNTNFVVQPMAPINLSGEDEVNRCYIAFDEATETYYVVDEDKSEWPVVFIRWYGANLFAEFYGLELPSEAQWEFVAAGGSSFEYGTSDGTISSTKCNYDNNLGYPLDANALNQNPFGFHQMSCNVWIWMADWFQSDFYSLSSGATDPLCTDGYDPVNDGTETGVPGGVYSSPDSLRSLRGGSYNYHSSVMRANYRRGDYPFRGNDHFSFRVAAPLAVPFDPLNVVAEPFDTEALVSWEAAFDNGRAVTAYSVTSSQGGAPQLTTGATSITFTGLVNDVATTFSVTATNAIGTGPASEASDAVSPLPIAVINADGSVSDIALSDGTDVGFAAATTSYSVAVPYATSTVAVLPTTTRSVTAVSVSPSAAEVALSVDVAVTFTVVATSVDGSDVHTYTVAVTRQAYEPSDNAFLSDCVTDAALVRPSEFDFFVFDYDVTVDNDVPTISFTLTLDSELASATIDGVAGTTGTVSLAPGVAQDVYIVVTAEDGTTQRAYTYNVWRPAVTTSAAFDIEVAAGLLTPSFHYSTTTYTLALDSAVTQMTFTVSPLDSSATITVEGTATDAYTASASLPAAGPTRTNTIVVTSPDGSATTTYLITTIPQASGVNTDPALVGLTLDAAESSWLPAFFGGRYEFFVDVPAGTATVAITPTTTGTCSITVDGTAVASGSASGDLALAAGVTREIPIVSTAEDGYSSYSYVVHVTAGVSTETANNNANLVWLLTSGGPVEPTFQATTYAYTQTVAYSVSSVTVTATLSDALGASLTVEGSAFDSGAESHSVPVSAGATVSIPVVVTAEDGVTVNTYTIGVTRAAASDDASLSALTVSDGDLDPAFDPAVTSYTLDVGFAVDSVDVAATATDAAAVLGSFDATTALTAGATATISITVTAEDGTVATYSIAATRAAAGTDSSLASLSVSDGDLSPAFDPAVLAYTVDVDFTVNSLTVAPVRADLAGTISYTPQSALTSGATTTISIVVTAEDGTTVSTYTVDATRAAANSDSSLSALSVSDGDLDPSFSSGVFAYDVSVGYLVNSLTVAATLTDDTAAASYTATSALAQADTTVIDVLVTAQDSSTSTYTISAYREGPSADASLSSLTVSTGTMDPVFATDVYEYSVDVGYAVSILTIVAAPTDDTAVVTKSRLVGLTAGATSSFDIDVVAQDGSTALTYTIHVTRGGNFDASLSALTITSGLQLSPGFQTSTLTYVVYAAYAYETLEVLTAVPTDSNAAGVAYAASSPLAEGGNTTVVITVTAQDGVSQQNYTLIGVRAWDSDSTLASLAVTDCVLDPPFEAAITDYTTFMHYTVADAVVTAAATDDDNAVVAFDTTTALEPGDVVDISVVVTAANGVHTTTYVIEATRAATDDTWSSDASLGSLSIADGTFDPTFHANTHSYAVTVPYETTEAVVTAAVADSTAVATYTETTALDVLVPVTIEVSVAAQDTVTVEVYSMAVTRLENDDSLLASLSVSDGTLDPAFDPAVTSYTLAVDYEVGQLTTTPVASDAAGATLTYTEVTDLPSGAVTTVLVVVAAADATETTYSIVVTRAANDDASLSSLVFGAGTLAPDFDSDTLFYSLAVDFAVASVDLTATTTDTTGEAAAVYLSTTALASGVPKNITVQVTAEDGTRRVYYVTATRALSNVATLASLGLSVGSLSPSFSASVYAYTTAVLYTDESVSITEAETSDVNAAAAYDDSAVALTAGAATDLVVVVTAHDGVSTATYTVTVTRAAASTTAALAALEVSEGTLSPPFNPSTLAYTLAVSYSVAEVTVTPTVTNQYATVSGFDTPTALASGVTESITVVVVAQDGVTTKTYTIDTTRALNTDATLASLALSDGTLSPQFVATTQSYTALLAYEVTSVSIAEATPTDSEGATVAADTTAVDVAEGASVTLTATVTAADGSTTRVYDVVATRAVFAASSDATLSSLGLSYGTLSPAFSADVYAYDVSTPWGINSMTISPVLADDGGTAVYTATTALASDSTTSLSVVVTAADGSTSLTYVIDVFREPNSDATLASIAVTNGTLSPPFTWSTFEYTLSVAYEVPSLELVATPVDPNAEVTTSPSSQLDLVAGETQTVTVVIDAEDDISTLTYVVDVSRGASKDASLSSLTVSEGALDPAFSADVFEYTVTVEYAVESLDVAAEATDAAGATLTFDATAALASAATTTIEVLVTAADGLNTLTYAIDVARAANDDATLSALTLSDGEVTSFDPATLAYTVDVTNDVTSIVIASATPTDANAAAVVFDDVAVDLVTEVPVTLSVTVTAEDGTTTLTYTVEVTRQISSDVTLASLGISEGILAPNFSPDTTSYKVNVPRNKQSITITAVPTDSTALVSYAATTALSEGSPATIPILVTAADGQTTQVVTLIVTRAANGASTVATLSSLAVSDGTLSPSFSASTSSYTVDIDVLVDEVTVTAMATEAAATISYDLTMAVAAGTTETQTIIVTPGVGRSAQSYSLSVTRPAMSSDSSLASLTVSEGSLDPAFDAGVFAYAVAVEYEVESIDVAAAVTDSTAAAVFDTTTALTAGASQDVVIVVTAQDGSVSTYTVSVARAPIGSDASLASLSVSSGSLDPVFDAGVFAYAVAVEYEVESIDVAAAVTDSSAVAVFDTTTALTAGASQDVVIVVTAQDGTTQLTYTLTVTRAGNADASLAALVISSGSLDPSFSGTVYEYAVDVDYTVSVMTVTPVTTDANAAAAYDLSTELESAATTSVVIVVTAQDGATQLTYTLLVTRAGSPIATLSALTVSDGMLQPTFAPASKSYSLVVLHSVETLTVAATTTHSNAVATYDATTALVQGETTLVEVTVVAEDGETTATYQVYVDRPDPSSDSSLSALSVSAGSLDPSFSAGVFEYAVAVDNSVASVDLTAVSSDSAAVVAFDDSAALAEGVATTFTITVTAEDGSTSVYTVVVTRAEADSTDSSLSSLSVSSGSLDPSFSAGVFEYALAVGHDVESVEFLATVSDSAAAVAFEDSVALDEGSSATMTFTVTAQDGSVSVYTVEVTRASTPSSDSSLSSLSVSAGSLDPAFSADVFNYAVAVGNSVTSFDVTPAVANAHAVATFEQTTALLAGETAMVSITVTAEDGSTSVYSLAVTRALPDASSDSSLSSLSVSSGSLDPSFSAGVFEYAVAVDNSVASVELTAVASDSAAVVAFDDSAALEEGVATTFTITVTAEDGSTSVYTVVVTRAEADSTDSSLSSLSVSSGSLDPSFSAGVFEYAVAVDNSVASVELTAVASDSAAVVAFDDSATLEEGVATTFTVTVTAEDGSTTVYTVVVTRAEANTDSSLSSLSVSDGELTPAFDAAVFEYTVDVDVDSLTLAAVANDATAVAAFTETTALTAGATTEVEVVVTAQDGSSSTYTVTVTRLDFQWTWGEWSDCDAECGEGSQTRSSSCVEQAYGVAAEAEACDGEQPADESQACEASLACETFSWTVGEWGACDVACYTDAEAGVQRRSVTCRSSTGAQAAGSCTDAEPASSRDCEDVEQCAELDWSTGDWSACSESCGGGEMSRTVECVDTLTGEAAEDCDASTQPEASKACNTAACETFFWAATTSWGDCSAECDTGTQTREAACFSSLTDAAVSDESQCDDAAAVETSRDCNEDACEVVEECACVHGTCSDETGECECESDAWVGDFCQTTAECADGSLDVDGECCLDAVDVAGVCCASAELDACGVCGGESAAVDVDGDCCAGGVDSSGQCCDTEVNECGVCGGADTAVIALDGSCCEGGVLDAGGICCGSGYIDSCLVCDGDGRSCGLDVTVNSVNTDVSDPNTLTDTGSPEYASAAGGVRTDVSGALGIGEDRVSDVTFQVVSSRRRLLAGVVDVSFTVEADTVVDDLDALSDAIADDGALADAAALDGAQAAVTARAVDAAAVFLECPGACSSQGICLPSTGVCECYSGYTGEDCSGCPDGQEANGDGGECVVTEEAALTTYLSGSSDSGSGSEGDDDGATYADLDYVFLGQVCGGAVVALIIFGLAVRRYRTRAERQAMRPSKLNEPTEPYAIELGAWRNREVPAQSNPMKDPAATSAVVAVAMTAGAAAPAPGPAPGFQAAALSAYAHAPPKHTGRPKPPPAKPIGRGDRGSVVGEWKEAQDGNGTTYYYNTVTKQTSWTRPEHTL